MEFTLFPREPWTADENSIKPRTCLEPNSNRTSTYRSFIFCTPALFRATQLRKTSLLQSARGRASPLSLCARYLPHSHFHGYTYAIIRYVLSVCAPARLPRRAARVALVAPQSALLLCAVHSRRSPVVILAWRRADNPKSPANQNRIKYDIQWTAK